MAGEKDIVKEGDIKLIDVHIPKCTLLIASKETHYYPAENAIFFNKAVLDFLGEK